MLGKLLGDSGGADRIVDTLLCGRPVTLRWKIALIAVIIGIPMFFEVGLVLLLPVVMLEVRRSGGRALRLGIPALAGLSVLHGFIPPHPGPVAAIGILHTDIGITLALGLVVAIPTVAVCGPLLGPLAARWVPIGAAGAALAFTGTGTRTTGTRLGFGPRGAAHGHPARRTRRRRHRLSASRRAAGRWPRCSRPSRSCSRVRRPTCGSRRHPSPTRCSASSAIPSWRDSSRCC